MKNEEIEILERQGCFSNDWSKVEIAEGSDLRRIRNVYFSGPVTIGKEAEIINVPGGISNVRIGDGVRIVNVARIENSPGATFGIGTDVAVLDETGNRPVRIYPGISAQVAAIAARMPEYAKETLLPLTDRHIAEITATLTGMPEIGDGAEILDCGPIVNVRVWPGAKIEGAARLENGCIVNNCVAMERRFSTAARSPKSTLPGRAGANPLVYVGNGVDAENFIIEDGTVSGGCLIRDTYVGQGAVLDKGFTSHDSLFFANCAMENGEACAVLAGPYTVSMHKSSLLIGCQTSFMNAGSGTNMSNHMYKLGPVHWGVLERGVKTSSNSYMMHGSRIGVFSLVMGEHKTHPDSSAFPFSYLFGDKDGYTIVVPGAMLRSFGLKRDGDKWPKRDRRLGHGIRLNDRITYSILNPHTADIILEAIELSDRLLSLEADETGHINYKGMKIKKSSLVKGRNIYELAICKYLHTLKEGKDADKRVELSDKVPSQRWLDLSGQIIAESNFKEIINSGSIEEMEAALDKAVADFEAAERLWAAQRIKDRIDGDPISDLRASEFDAMIEKDRKVTLSQIAKENDMLTFL